MAKHRSPYERTIRKTTRQFADESEPPTVDQRMEELARRKAYWSKVIARLDRLMQGEESDGNH